MKWIIAVLLPLMLMADNPKKKESKPAPQSGSISIPADAEQIGPQVFRHTDKDGKTWIYRRTPFGISKVEEQKPQGSEAQPTGQAIPVKVTDLGDSVRFEQETPMGNRVWTKKKTELSELERSWVDAKLNNKTRER